MARQWVVPEGGYIDEDGTEEFVVPEYGYFNEDQAAAGAAVGPTLHHPLDHMRTLLTR